MDFSQLTKIRILAIESGCYGFIKLSVLVNKLTLITSANFRTLNIACGEVIFEEVVERLLSVIDELKSPQVCVTIRTRTLKFLGPPADGDLFFTKSELYRHEFYKQK